VPLNGEEDSFSAEGNTVNAEYPWLNRDDPRYDPNRIGSITEAKVIAALVAAGKLVLLPHLSAPPYDLALDEDGRLRRIQCKTGRLTDGVVVFRPHRLRAAHRESGWQRRVTAYTGLIDYFGVYCPENDRVYLVPIEDVTTTRAFSMRVSPPRNNQVKRIRWADDYLVRPIDTALLLPPAESLLFEEMGP
jgi:hypothetical protein